MLVNGIAFLLVEFGGVGTRQVVENLFDRSVNVCRGLLAFTPVENQLGFFQSLQQSSSDFLTSSFSDLVVSSSGLVRMSNRASSSSDNCSARAPETSCAHSTGRHHVNRADLQASTRDRRSRFSPVLGSRHVFELSRVDGDESILWFRQWSYENPVLARLE